MVNNFKNQKGLTHILILVIIVALAGASIFGYTHYLKNKQPSKDISTKKVTLGRSKAPGIVSNLALTKEIDAKTGLPKSAGKNFSQKDQAIYLTMNLNKAKKGTNIEYVRFINGQYLDHGSIEINQDNDTIANFSWHLNPGSLRLPGTYRVKIYTNGIFEKALSYKII